MPGLIQGFDPSKKGLWTLKLQNSLFSIASKGLEQDKENWQISALELLAVTFELGMIDYPQFLLTRTSRRI
jgi:hypothetical protein